ILHDILHSRGVMLRDAPFIRAILWIASLPVGVYGTHEFQFRESRIAIPDCAGSQNCADAVAVISEAHQALARSNYPQAERLFRQSSVLVERAFGPEHFALAYVLHAQGLLLQAQGATRACLPPFE